MPRVCFTLKYCHIYLISRMDTSDPFRADVVVGFLLFCCLNWFLTGVVEHDDWMSVCDAHARFEYSRSWFLLVLCTLIRSF